MSGSRSPKAARPVFALLTLLLLLGLLLHVGFGSTSFVSPIGVLRELLAGPGDSSASSIVWNIRLPRGLGCICIGAILGIVGAAFQALFRNPLAEPYIVGVSSGAAVGGAIAEVVGIGGLLGQIALAAAGGVASLLLVLAIAGRRGVTRTGTLLLSGVVIGSMLAALLSLVLLAAGQDANRILFWLMGDAGRLVWPSLPWLALGAIAAAVLLIPQGRALNAYAVGEETAARLGVSTRALKWRVLLTGSVATAISVGAVGVVAFVGLVAPHIARGILGVDWRRSMPAAAFVGAILVLFADALSQRWIPLLTKSLGYDPVIGIPVGVVTAIIGAPSLLIVLRQSRNP